MEDLNKNGKDQWSSKIGVILAVAGSAVGLGNFLRFPGLAAQYGGGIFLIPYFTAFLLLGLPLAWMEWSLGRYGGRHGYNSVPGIYHTAWRHPVAPYLGVLGVVMPVMIFSYYLYVEAWCLSYALRYLFCMMSPSALGITPEMVIGYLGSQPDILYDFFKGNAALLGSVDLSSVNAYLDWVKANPDAFNSVLSANQDAVLGYLQSQTTLNNSIYYNIFFGNLIGIGGNGEALGNVAKYGALGSSLVTLLICFVLNYWIIFNGISKGIERFCLYAMPALFVCSIIVLIRVLTLGTPNPELPDQNLVNGLGFMWNPVKPGSDVGFWESLMRPDMWMAAAGQVFFSLSVGFGLILTYASYINEKEDLAFSAFTAASANSFAEVVLGGLITLPAAFVFLGGSYLEGHMGSTFELGFKVLPNVFSQMPAGQFFGFLFFFLLFLAAVTSTVSMLQPSIALFEEGLGMRRKDSVAFLGFITLIGLGFTVYFSSGLAAMDNLDFWMGQALIFVLATIQAILFAYALGMKKGMAELRNHAKMRIPRFVEFVMKYVTPSYLIIVFIAWSWTNLPDRVHQVLTDKIAFMSVVIIGAVCALILYVISRAVAVWKEKDANYAEASGIYSLDENDEVN